MTKRSKISINMGLEDDKKRGTFRTELIRIIDDKFRGLSAQLAAQVTAQVAAERQAMINKIDQLLLRTAEKESKRGAKEEMERNDREQAVAIDVQELLSTQSSRQEGAKPMEASEEAMVILGVIRTLDLGRDDTQEPEASRRLRLQGGWRAHEENRRNYCIITILTEAMLKDSDPISEAVLAEKTSYLPLDIGYGIVHAQRHVRRAGYEIVGDDETGWRMTAKDYTEEA